MAGTSSIGDVCRFFGMKLAEFKAEWAKLSDLDKQQIRDGIADGTYNYVPERNHVAS